MTTTVPPSYFYRRRGKSLDDGASLLLTTTAPLFSMVTLGCRRWRLDDCGVETERDEIGFGLERV
ncbi:hypothetical protein C1H46_034939 [Malus baccata]|uniref:Uncharacterized protein n=1 Tax=Malus baccata TaxID=106549 RepID=A0A540KZ86_MALBA|nr:hypothetical protein C1H46_034939 [Malus baccata]